MATPGAVPSSAEPRRLSSEEAVRASGRRDALLAACRAAGASGEGGDEAKLRHGKLSPGCLSCLRGGWSCLRVNSDCRLSCFFCLRRRPLPDSHPVSEMTWGEPGVGFSAPEDYGRFLSLMGFDGVCLTGGEPLGDLDSCEAFLRAARRALPSGHLWMNTSGLNLTPASVERLVRAGLDELRVDLAAVGYDPRRLKAAAGRVRTLTVEIPAVPEDGPRLRALLRALAEAGVNHLNLHQLLPAEEARAALAARGYSEDGATPLTGIIESELSALETLLAAAEEGLPLGVSVCPAAYKDRYHGRLRRRLLSAWACSSRGPWRGFGETTPAGLTRVLSVRARGAEGSRLARRLGADARPRPRRDGPPDMLLRRRALRSPALARRLVRAEYWSWSAGNAHESADDYPAAAGGRTYLRARPEGPVRALELRAPALEALLRSLEAQAPPEDPFLAGWRRFLEGCEGLPSGLPPIR